MAEQEVNTINHLLEIEQNAEAMTRSAQLEADKKISAAKAKADADFKVEYDKIVAENEKIYEEKTAAIQADSQQKIKEYKDKITSSSVDAEAFNKLLDKVLA